VALHDIPGGEEAFELCAKFCYGISISISAANLVPAMLAARFLRMTEAVAKGNLVAKLEAFFNSCVLQGWKDSVAALQAAWRISGWSESRIVQPCIDSIVEKILTPPAKVTWSYTYTRPGYTRKSAPAKDWWTEDISELDVEDIDSTVQAKKKEVDGLVSADATPRALAVVAKDRNGDTIDFCYWAPRHDDLAEVEKEVWASF